MAIDFKKLAQLAMAGAAAYATPSKVDDVAAALSILNAGREMLRQAKEKKLAEKQAHMDASLNSAKLADDAHKQVSVADEVLQSLEGVIK